MNFTTVPVSSFDASKLGITAPNKTGNKASFELLYDGNPFALQVGSSTDPVKTFGGLQYWNAGRKRFETVASSKDYSWALSGKSANSRRIGGKLNLSLAFVKYDVEGTQGWYANKAFKAIDDYIIGVLKKGYESGDVKIPFFDIDIPRELLERMTKTSYRESSDEYDSGASIKVAYYVSDTKDGTPTGTSSVVLNAAVIDSATGKQADDGVAVIQPRAEGVWLVAPNKITVEATEISSSFELLKAKATVVPTRYELAEFVDEPVAKKIKTEVNQVTVA